MRLFGAPITRADPRRLVAQGVARMPEDRQHGGVVGTMSVADNIAIEDVRSPGFSRFGFLDRNAMQARARDAIAAYDVRCPGPDAEARLLSGGNVQKLILARVLEREPRVILANQPTRGLDIGAQAEIHRRIIAARDRGAAVLVISEDLDELFALADRFLVIHAGEVAEAGSITGPGSRHHWPDDGRSVPHTGDPCTMSLRLDPREHASIALRLLVSLLSGAIALLLVAIPVMAAGANPFEAYVLMAQGAFGSMFALSETLNRATPLILTGLAAAVAFRARLWNIGAEGQLYMGALAAVLVGSGFLQLPAPLAIPAIMLAGFVAGGLMMVIPAMLKQRFGADEVVITLLLNFVVILFIQMLIEGPLKDPLAMGGPNQCRSWPRPNSTS